MTPNTTLTATGRPQEIQTMRVSEAAHRLRFAQSKKLPPLNMKTILFILVALTVNAAPPEKFWSALHLQETGGALGATIGDNGAALGPYQIHRAYFKDSKVNGDYTQCADLAFSRKVVSAYLQRYAPKAWASGESGCEVLFRTHNGGPSATKAVGQKKKNLDRYSAKALGLMQ